MASAVPPVDVVPPNPSSACNLSAPAVIKVISKVEASVAIALDTSSAASVSVPPPHRQHSTSIL